MSDNVDVAVTDGFTGNVTLKTLEGGHEGADRRPPRRVSPRTATRPTPTPCCRRSCPLYNTLNPDTYGGAILLGVDGVCIISHGSSRGHRDPQRHRRRRRDGRARHGRRDQAARLIRARATGLAGSAGSLRSPIDACRHSHRARRGLRDRRDRLADILEIDPSVISEGQSFVDDLDADSLALIELVEALEEELSERAAGFRIDDEDLADLKTVRDAVDYVVERTRQGG